MVTITGTHAPAVSATVVSRGKLHESGSDQESAGKPSALKPSGFCGEGPKLATVTAPGAHTSRPTFSCTVAGATICGKIKFAGAQAP